jgi:hypothetical protein
MEAKVPKGFKENVKEHVEQTPNWFHDGWVMEVKAPAHSISPRGHRNLLTGWTSL